jgi:hypothetical protein
LAVPLAHPVARWIRARSMTAGDVHRQSAAAAARSVEALVALGGVNVDSQQLMAALWPDADGAAAKTSFDWGPASARARRRQRAGVVGGKLSVGARWSGPMSGRSRRRSTPRNREAKPRVEASAERPRHACSMFIRSAARRRRASADRRCATRARPLRAHRCAR